MGVLDLLDLPVVGAPMAGGVSSPLLVAAVSDAGGLGMLAAGYRTPEQLAADLVHTRDLTDRPFGEWARHARPALSDAVLAEF